jgi:hypothetical protein
MGLLARKKQLAAKIESEKGTRETSLAAVDADILADSIDFSFAPEEIQREYLRATFSKDTSIVGPLIATISCKVELKGSGTATTPPSWGKLLTACGFKESISSSSVSYQVDTDDADTETLTMAEYNDGHQRIMYAARGAVTFEFTANRIAYANYAFTGIYYGDADIEMLSPDYESTLPVPFRNASFTLNYGTPWTGAVFSALNFDMGNEVALREDANATLGLAYAQIVNRDPRGTIDLDKVLVATQDFESHLTTPTTGSIAFGLGTDAGNTLSFSIPKMQILSLPGSERDGVSTYDMAFACRVNAGDDEFVITQT